MKRLRNSRGISFIEVMAGSTVLLLMAGVMAGATMTVIKHNQTSRDTAAAVALAHQQIEELRATEPWLLADLQGGEEGPLDPLDGSDANRRFFRRWTVTPDSPVKGTTLVSVTVSWGADKSHHINAAVFVCTTETCS
jgi:Tfp pilus assembly protein PilV